MEKQFCDYEIALKLKELGYGDEVMATFTTEDKKLNIFSFSVPNKGIFEMGFKKGWAIKAPLWQEIIDWFMKKHKIYIAVLPYRDDDIELCWYYTLVNDSDSDNEHYLILLNETDLHASENFDTPEEARREAILEAIKTIKK